MILYVNTIKNRAEEIEIKIFDGEKEVASKFLNAKMAQSEKLIPEIDALLKKTKIDLKQIEKIKVENIGGSFTALRIGITTANALGYALNIPVEGTKTGQTKKNKLEFSVVEPMYEREADITISKKNVLN